VPNPKNVISFVMRIIICVAQGRGKKINEFSASHSLAA
jgi:hypothetical protein